jgi:hypothetical protein
MEQSHGTSPLRASHATAEGGMVMPEIFPVRDLNRHDNYADVDVYQYKDSSQSFYFDCQIKDEDAAVVKDGTVVKPATYSVLISNLGKVNWGSTATKPIQQPERCKAEIQKYFHSHPAGIAKLPPIKVLFV